MDLYFLADVQIGVPTCAIEHHEDLVKARFAFNPSRWLDQDEKLPEEKQHREALDAVFTATSVGARAGLGKKLVQLEVSIAIGFGSLTRARHPHSIMRSAPWMRVAVEGDIVANTSIMIGS